MTAVPMNTDSTDDSSKPFTSAGNKLFDNPVSEHHSLTNGFIESQYFETKHTFLFFSQEHMFPGPDFD